MKGSSEQAFSPVAAPGEPMSKPFRFKRNLTIVVAVTVATLLLLLWGTGLAGFLAQLPGVVFGSETEGAAGAQISAQAGSRTGVASTVIPSTMPLSTGSSGQVARAGMPVQMPDSADLHARMKSGPFGPGSSKVDISALKNELVEVLRAEFTEGIDRRVVQVQLLPLLRQLLLDYPSQGRDFFSEVVRLAFPAYHAEIIDSVHRMELYDAWLLANAIELDSIPGQQRVDRLWVQREKLFGADASEIWSGMMDAGAERDATMARTADLLATAYDTPMEDRMYLFKTAFEDGYANSASDLVADTAAIMTQVFFTFDSVQRDLQALSGDRRQAEINRIRRYMGYPEDRIAALEERDQYNQIRWDRGREYMQRRAELDASMQGSELEYAVQSLQNEMFGREAHTIRREEEDLGFFRFNRPRLYGRN